MAKAVVTLSDTEDGTLNVELEFTPELTREAFEAGHVTEAQAVALLLIQDLVTDELGKASAAKFDTNELQKAFESNNDPGDAQEDTDGA